MLKIQIIAVLSTLAFFLFVLELIRRGYLKEKYAILWLGSCVALLILSFWRGLLEVISGWIGIFYPPSLLFLLAFFFLLVIVLHFSVVISRMTEKNKRLAQEMGLLKTKMDHLEKKGRNAG